MCTYTSLHPLKPPYKTFGPSVSLAGVGPDSWKPGTHLGIRFEDCETNRNSLDALPALSHNLAVELRRLNPMGAPLLWLPVSEPAEAIAYAVRARVLGFAAVIWGEHPSHALRMQLTDVVGLPQHVANVLEATGRVTGSTARTISEVLGPVHPNGTVRGIASQLGVVPRTVERRFERTKLLPPSAWLSMLRTLRRVLVLQRHVGKSIPEIARILGLADASSLSRDIRRRFGCTTGEARALLGPESFLVRWFDSGHRNLPA